MRAVLTALAIWCAGLGAAAQFAKMSVIFDELGGLYPGHGAVGIGIMVSIIGVVGLLLGTTMGMLVARIGPRRAMLAALALGAAMSFVQSFLPPYPLMVVSRIPEGLAHLGIVVVGPTAIAATASRRFQGLVMTLWGSFFGLTFSVLAYVGPGLAAAQGAGLLFRLHGVWLLICLAALAVLMPRDPDRAGAAPLPGLWELHRDTYASPRIAAPAMGFACYTVTYVAVLTLLPGAVTPGWGPFVAVTMPLVSIAVSLTLGVALLSLMSAVQLVQSGFAVVVVAAIGLWASWGSGAPEAGFAVLLACGMGVVQGASFAAIPQLNASLDHRARAAGAIAQLGNVGTTLGTPLLVLILARTGAGGLAVFLMAFAVLGIVLHQWQVLRRISG